MLRGDKTGLLGKGPMTGRGRRVCAGFRTRGNIPFVFTRGFGFGRGGGRDFGRGLGFHSMSVDVFGSDVSSPEDVGFLKARASSLQNEICVLNDRIEELESAASRKNNQ